MDEERNVVGIAHLPPSGHWKIRDLAFEDDVSHAVQSTTLPSLIEGHVVAGKLVRRGKGNRFAVIVTDDFGLPQDMDSLTPVLMRANDMPFDFPPDVEACAQACRAANAHGREDLRKLPLVTIDGPDARDFDDAVWAGFEDERWHLVVAIADVAHYVQPDSPLDDEAIERGNSTYFPDRVVPMLPEALSNDLCSLKPDQDRASLAVHLWLDTEGNLENWRFERALIRSHARLTYEQVQRAYDGQPDAQTSALMETVIRPLYAAYEVLRKAREARGTLDFNFTESAVCFDDSGAFQRVDLVDRIDSQRLIESFMVCANVAAARQLEGDGSPCLYRVHEPPSATRFASLQEALRVLDSPVRADKPESLGQVLRESAGKPYERTLSSLILRAQSRAFYSPYNTGHFGLALSHYAHFTSPIRRYADLVVHRALIRSLELGEGGLSQRERDTLGVIATRLSVSERQSDMVEREAIRYYIARSLFRQKGRTFGGEIVGMSRRGIEVRINEIGTEGYIPVAALPRDRYFVDKNDCKMSGQKTGLVLCVGDRVEVRLSNVQLLPPKIDLTLVTSTSDRG